MTFIDTAAVARLDVETAHAPLRHRRPGAPTGWSWWLFAERPPTRPCSRRLLARGSENTAF